MNPELTATLEEVNAHGWIKPGSIILTSRRAWYATAIRAFQSLTQGNPTIYQHAVRGLDFDGTVMSQNWKIQQESLAKYIGCWVRAYDPPCNYTEDQINAILARTYQAEGRRYDWLGIVGQMFNWLPVVGSWVQARVQFPFRTYCSEFICITEREADPLFMAPQTCRVNPNELDLACKAQGRTSHTFKLIA